MKHVPVLLGDKGFFILEYKLDFVLILKKKERDQKKVLGETDNQKKQKIPFPCTCYR